MTKKATMKEIYCLISGKYRKFKNPKISYIFEQKTVIRKKFLLFAVSVRMKMKK